MKIRFVPNVEPLNFWWSHRGWTRQMFVNIHNFENMYFFFKLFLKPFSHFHHHLSSQTLIMIKFLGEMKKKILLGKKLLKVFYPLIWFLPSPRFRLFSHISLMSKRRLWEGLWFSVNSTSFLPPFGFSKSFLPH